jgi:calcineurin-like phosphoesterase family protein
VAGGYTRFRITGVDLMKWITSDQHFYHNKIIGYCDRPFKDVNEMNYEMLARWNNIVSVKDTVYHLGDIALTNKGNKTDLINKLHGKIILILGNHDKGKRHNLDCGINEVIDYLVLHDNKLILSHAPLFEMPTLNVSVENWNYYPIPLPKSKTWIQLCGHSHNNYLMRFKNE